MQARNFYILIASIVIGLVIFWLFFFAVIELNTNLLQDPNTLTIKGDGVNREIILTTSQIKSDK